MSDALSISVQGLDGTWKQLGTDSVLDGGGLIESLTFTKSLPGNSDQASVSIKRTKGVGYLDIKPFNPLHIGVGQMDAWSGRTIQAPRSEDRSVSLQAQGWWQHLKEDVIDKEFVVNDLSRWKDARSFLGQPVGYFAPSGYVEVGAGAIQFGWQQNTAANANRFVGFTIDLGPNNRVKRIVFTSLGSQNLNAFSQIYVRGHDSEDAATGQTEDAYMIQYNLFTDGVKAGSFATARRYVTIFMYRSDGASGAVGADHVARITDIKLFMSTFHESGNVSILKAKDVISGVLSLTSPKIKGSDSSLLATTTYNIEQLGSNRQWRSVEDYINYANAYHAYAVKTTNEKTARVSFQPVATRARWIANTSEGGFQNTGSDDGTEIFNRAIVEFDTPSGQRRYATALTEPYPAAVLADSPVGYWRLGGLDTAIAADISPSNANMLPSSATFTTTAGPLATGRRAASFDGTRYYGGATNPDTGIGDTFTIEAWFQRSSTLGTIQFIYADQQGRGIFMNASNQLTFTSIGVANLGNTTTTYGNDGLWHHVVWTKSGATNVAYVDGVAVAVTWTNATWSIANNRNFVGSDNAGNQKFVGSIAEVAFYQQALTAARVAAHYSAASQLDRSIAARRGIVRTKVLPARIPLTAGGGQQIANATLAVTQRPPLKGRLVLTMNVRSFPDNTPMPVEIIDAGDGIWIEDLEDPVTGSKGRFGIVARVDYDYANGRRQATLTIDSDLDHLDVILNRLAGAAA